MWCRIVVAACALAALSGAELIEIPMQPGNIDPVVVSDELNKKETEVPTMQQFNQGSVFDMFTEENWTMMKSKILEGINVFRERNDGSEMEDMLPMKTINSFIQLGDSLNILRAVNKKLDPKLNKFLSGQLNSVFSSVDSLREAYVPLAEFNGPWIEFVKTLTYKGVDTLVSQARSLVKKLVSESDLKGYADLLAGVNPMAASGLDYLLDLSGNQETGRSFSHGYDTIRRSDDDGFDVRVEYVDEDGAGRPAGSYRSQSRDFRHSDDYGHEMNTYGNHDEHEAAARGISRDSYGGGHHGGGGGHGGGYGHSSGGYGHGGGHGGNIGYGHGGGHGGGGYGHGGGGFSHGVGGFGGFGGGHGLGFIELYPLLLGLGLGALLGYIFYRLTTTTMDGRSLDKRDTYFGSLDSSDVPDLMNSFYSLMGGAEAKYDSSNLEDEISDNLNSLWYEYDNSGGCVRCVLFRRMKDKFLGNQSSFQNIITTMMAHMLGGEGSGQLVDEMAGQQDA